MISVISVQNKRPRIARINTDVFGVDLSKFHQRKLLKREKYYAFQQVSIKNNTLLKHVKRLFINTYR